MGVILTAYKSWDDPPSRHPQIPKCKESQRKLLVEGLEPRTRGHHGNGHENESESFFDGNDDGEAVGDDGFGIHGPMILSPS